MVEHANKHRSDRVFQESEWVYQKVQPYRQVTMSGHHFTKLSAKYYGTYQILQKIGSVAYKLSLPSQLLLHPTFHVSQLKPCHKLPAVISHPPMTELSSPYCPQPFKILDRRMVVTSSFFPFFSIRLKKIVISPYSRSLCNTFLVFVLSLFT